MTNAQAQQSWLEKGMVTETEYSGLRILVMSSGKQMGQTEMEDEGEEKSRINSGGGRQLSISCASGGQSIGVSASASVLPMNVQG